jgi:hypothetical protein
MGLRMKTLIHLATVAMAVGSLSSAPAQVIHPGNASSRRTLASNVIMPQARSAVWPPGSAAGVVQFTEVNVGVDIVGQVATTTLDISRANPSGARLEAEMVLPVPDKAVLRGFTLLAPSIRPAIVSMCSAAAKAAFSLASLPTR